MHLDPTLKPIIKQELKKLGESVRAKHVSENKNYWASSKVKWEEKAQYKKGKKKEFLRQEALTQAGNKEGHEINTNTVNKVDTSALPLKVNVKLADKVEYLTTAIRKENADRDRRLDTINQIKEDIHTTSSEKTVECHTQQL